mgnify:CR=1 FL=1
MPYECALVVALSVVDLADEQVSLRVGGGAVSMKELARVVAGVTSDVGDDLERLAIQHPHRLVGSIDDVAGSVAPCPATATKWWTVPSA